MNADDVANWVEQNRDNLIKDGLLTIQSQPADDENPEREVWFLKFEK